MREEAKNDHVSIENIFIDARSSKYDGMARTTGMYTELGKEWNEQKAYFCMANGLYLYRHFEDEWVVGRRLGGWAYSLKVFGKINHHVSTRTTRLIKAHVAQHKDETEELRQMMALVEKEKHTPLAVNKVEVYDRSMNNHGAEMDDDMFKVDKSVIVYIQQADHKTWEKSCVPLENQLERNVVLSVRCKFKNLRGGFKEVVGKQMHKRPVFHNEEKDVWMAFDEDAGQWVIGGSGF